MKSQLSFALLAVFALTSCEIDEPPVRRTTTSTRTTTARYPAQTAGQYPPQPQPFQGDVQPADAGAVPPQDPAATAPTTATTTTDSAAATAPSGPAAAPKADYPYGVPVAGKPGFVRSPYSPDKMTDVRGYAPGTEVKDPYTQKIFLVP